MITALLLLSIVGGAFHCGWICPFGTLQEFAAKLSRKLGLPKVKVNKKLDTFLKSIRYLLLALISIFTFSIVFAMFKYDPRENLTILLTKHTLSTISLFIILVFIILSMFIERFFCRYLCIEGAKHGLLSLIRPFTIHRNDSCINCKKCDDVCPMNIQISTTSELRSPSCINCTKCVSACPVENTLKYKWIKTSYVNIMLYVLLALAGILTFIDWSPSEVPQEVIIMDKDTINYNSGTFTGEAMGFRGTLQVSIDVEKDTILSIEVIKHKEDMKWYNRAIKVIDQMISNQNTDVDTISGATYSSRAIIEATKNAIEKAKK